MFPCVSVKNMRECDAYTIEHFTSGRDLMYRAAYGVFLAVDHWCDPAIVVGSGNNGGDGFALACILHKKGIPCTVYTLSDRLSADSSFYAEQANAFAVPILAYSQGCLQKHAVIVDCLLGTGFNGPVRDVYRNVITEINNSGAYVVSVDINSGMNGDTGEAEIAVCSDLTVTIGYFKIGLLCENAGKYIRRLVCCDIGIHLIREEWWLCLPGEQFLPESLHIPSWVDCNILSVRDL